MRGDQGGTWDGGSGVDLGRDLGAWDGGRSGEKCDSRKDERGKRLEIYTPKDVEIPNVFLG
jgi:hypothetical protein